MEAAGLRGLIIELTAKRARWWLEGIRWGPGAAEKNRQRVTLTAELVAQVERVRMFGSAAHDLVWLAEGRVDGAIVLSNKPLDLAAGILIAREAGAVVIDSSGAQHTPASTDTIAAAPGIVDRLLDLVRRAA